MAPLPKRRNSSRRQGKREKAKLRVVMTQTNTCPKCQTHRLEHRACPKCGYYK